MGVRNGRFTKVLIQYTLYLYLHYICSIKLNFTEIKYGGYYYRKKNEPQEWLQKQKIH